MNDHQPDSTEECFARYLKSNLDPNAFAAFNKFMGDPPRSTLQDWFSGKNLPAGKALLRLRVYLDFLGYKVKELESLPPTIKQAVRMFGFGVMPIEYIAETLGIPKSTNGISQTLAFLRGSRGTTFAKLEALKAKISEYDGQLQKAVAQTSRPLLAVASCETPTEQEIVTQKKPPAQKIMAEVPMNEARQAASATANNRHTLALASRIMAIIPDTLFLHAHGESQEIELFRESVGRDTIVRLADALRALAK